MCPSGPVTTAAMLGKVLLNTRIAIVTYELLPERERLMPWRTVCEVVRGMRRRGYDARLISINRDIDQSYDSKDYDFPVCYCPSIDDCRSGVGDFLPDLVYWPITWRDGMKLNSHWHDWDCPTIVYHGGSCYSILHVLATMRHMPSLRLKNLVIEAFIPKGCLVRQLQKRRVSGVVCMTEFTRRALVKAGWPNERCIAIPPGIPALNELDEDTLCAEELGIVDQDYVLFLGNPLPIRGINVLLSAAPKVFARCENLKIVCLLRLDPGKEMVIALQKLLHAADRLNACGRFVCVTKSLSPKAVQQCIKHARAVVMPFISVPSEIPLGLLEAMQLGTPVIVTQSGGTSEFVGEAGWIIPPGLAGPLADAMISASLDVETRNEKAKTCLTTMGSHPTWEATADSWIEFSEQVYEIA